MRVCLVSCVIAGTDGFILKYLLHYRITPLERNFSNSLCELVHRKCVVVAGGEFARSRRLRGHAVNTVYPRGLTPAGSTPLHCLDWTDVCVLAFLPRIIAFWWWQTTNSFSVKTFIEIVRNLCQEFSCSYWSQYIDKYRRIQKNALIL